MINFVMNFIYTPVVARTKRNVYVITVEYEHGDADLSTESTFKVHSELELLKFLTEFDSAAEAIRNNRHYGTDLPKGFSDAVFAQSGMELERDQVYTNANNYFAAMSIKSIMFFDDSGARFRVEKA